MGSINDKSLITKNSTAPLVDTDEYSDLTLSIIFYNF